MYNTLNIILNLNQHLKDISEIKDSKINKSLDVTIKMWDRNPTKDLFQGNYSTCCIGMGDSNGKYMPHYLMNTVYNMIEIDDNITGDVIGNALCYFVKDDEEGKPAFVVDNIEIKNGTINSYDVGIDLRNAIAEYASNVSREVTGNDYTPIYLSDKYNDVKTHDLDELHKHISFIGDIACKDIYMDLYSGWVEKECNENGTEKIPDRYVYLLKLK